VQARGVGMPIQAYGHGTRTSGRWMDDAPSHCCQSFAIFFTIRYAFLDLRFRQQYNIEV
jgi:hypothetical protein